MVDALRHALDSSRLRVYAAGMEHRQNKLASVIRALVAEHALRLPPAVATAVSVVEVRVSTDLSYADVFLSAFEGVDRAVEALRAIRGPLRREVADASRIFRVPLLRFHRDVAGERSARVDAILQKIDAERRPRRR